jgi:hypothetical protein
MSRTFGDKAEKNHRPLKILRKCIKMIINTFLRGFLVIRSIVFILSLLFLLVPTLTQAQNQAPEETKTIYEVAKDAQGDKAEGYVLVNPDKLTLSAKEYQEKSTPPERLEFVKVEKIEGIIPEAISRESYYSVRLQKGQEIYTVKDKYTISLNTSVGVLTRMIDPLRTFDVFKDSSGQSFIRDKNLLLSLELRFW